MFNDGGPSRSEVTSITVTFDSDVSSVDASNFELTETVSDEVVTGLNVSVSGNVVTLTFDSGDHIIPSQADGIDATLADGNYELRYRIDGFGDSADRVDTFFRHYGLTAGEGSVGLGRLRQIPSSIWHQQKSIGPQRRLRQRIGREP